MSADDGADAGEPTRECPDCGGRITLSDVFERKACPHCDYSGEPGYHDGDDAGGSA